MSEAEREGLESTPAPSAPAAARSEAALARPAFDEPRPDALLPARLTPFAPPDPAAEGETRERLHRMTPAALRARRRRIDLRLHELGLAVGEPALAIPSVRGTGLVDIDRIVRKLDALERAREEAQMVREAERPEGGLLTVISHDLEWLGEAFTARELRTRRGLLVAELGMALCAVDQRVISEYAPHVRKLLDTHTGTARRIDELFVQARLLDEEFERRARDGEGEAPPKEIERVLSRALDSVDDVSSKVGGALVDLGARAAGAAVKGGGHAVWGLARGAAQGAYRLGARAIERAVTGDGSAGERSGEGPAPEGEGSDGADTPAIRAAAAPPRLGVARAAGPPLEEIPELIRKLASLRQEGILTDREFQHKKAELLSRL